MFHNKLSIFFFQFLTSSEDEAKKAGAKAKVQQPQQGEVLQETTQEEAAAVEPPEAAAVEPEAAAVEPEAAPLEQDVDHGAAVDQEVAVVNPLGDAARNLINEADGLARRLEVIFFSWGFKSTLCFLPNDV